MSKQWHQHNLRVHYKETDQMGVVHHANYVSWFEIGRTEYMREKGLNYRKIEELGLLLPVLDVNVRYQKPARYDDYVAIFTQLTDFSPVRLKFAYEVRRIDDTVAHNNYEERPYGELLSTGSTLHMWVNENWRPKRLDKAEPEIYQQLAALVQDES